MANKKKTAKKTTTKKNTKVNNKKKEIKEELVEEVDEEELDEEYEDEYDVDVEEYDDDEQEEYDEYEDEYEEEKPNAKGQEKGSKKPLIIVLIGLIAFFIISLVLPGASTPKEAKESTLTDWLNDTASNTVVTVIASSTCPHCQEYRPVITQLSIDNNFKLYFFEIDQLSSDDQQKLVSTFELSDYEGAVPYTFIVKDGEVVATTTGYADENSTKSFLKKYGILK